MATETSDVTYILDSKKALPNKLLQDDGSTTDITGRTVINPVDSYNAKTALPNKFLNPDGTYSTLNEIIASMVDTSIYVLVDELPDSGDTQKIYLLPDSTGGFVEYHWTGEKWDPIGMVEFNLSDYPTTKEMMNAIEASALQTLSVAKEYTDTKLANMSNTYVWTGQSLRLLRILKQIQKDNVTNATIYFDGFMESGAHQTGMCILPSLNITDGTHRINFINNNYINQETTTQGTVLNTKMFSATYTCEDGEIIDTSGIEEEITIGSSDIYSYLPTVDSDVVDSITFTPTRNSHPATKKYVDDSIQENITNVLGGEY